MKRQSVATQANIERDHSDDSGKLRRIVWLERHHLGWLADWLSLSLTPQESSRLIEMRRRGRG